MYRFAEGVYDDVEARKAVASNSQITSASSLAEDLRRIINNPEYSDVVFVCKDGAKVHASRLFLVARSDVLHRMLLNGMAESRLFEIPLSEISSTELLPVMEYLYTGDLREHKPQDWRHAWQIMSAASFFSIEGLKLIVQAYMLDLATHVKDETGVVATFLSTATEFVRLFDDKTIKVIANYLVCNLVFKSLQPEHLQALSAEALLFYLQTTQEEVEEPRVVTSTEFKRFRIAVMWCAIQQFGSEKPLEPESMPPEIQCVLDLLGKSPYQQVPMTSEQSEVYNNTKDVLALSVEKFLPLVDLRLIPAQFLVHIIEPMEIVPPRSIVEALRFHALRTTFESEEDVCGWFGYFTKLYCSPPENPSRIHKVAQGNGLALYNFPLNRHFLSSGRHVEWEFTIQEVGNSFMQFGVYYGDGEYLNDDKDLFSQPNGWALRMDSYGITLNRQPDGALIERNFFRAYGRACSALTYGRDYAHRNSKVKVCLNLVDRQCSFAIDGKNLGVAWSNMPTGTCYPAVSLGTGYGESKGAVSIKFLQAYEGKLLLEAG